MEEKVPFRGGGEGVRKKEQISQPFPLFYSLVSFRGRGGVGKRGKELFLPYKLFFL